MGLTIHWYHEMTKGASRSKIKEMLGVVKELAEHLEFAEVGEVVHLKGPEILEIYADRKHELSWFVNGACMYHAVEQRNGFSTHYQIIPKELIGLSLWPGKGCESMELMFGLYPGLCEVDVPLQKRYYDYEKHEWVTHKKARQRTGFAGRWLNSSFCKTTYSEDPMGCHLKVCVVLRAMEQYTDVHEVRDESNYYTEMDCEALGRAFESDHRMLAAFAGAFNDALDGSGMCLEAPITENPDFERLEHEGQSQVPQEFLEAMAMTSAVPKPENN